MDFIEFAEMYQRRTAKRMQDFEAVLKDAQRKMEFTAQQQAAARELYPRREPQPIARGDYSIPRKRVKSNGQVRSVLRREGPGASVDK
ncbi:hypothetical protein CGLAU_02240 [Corynebacterium glaucum]|uniref:Uncharacterized protein n=1 Tax=Corynebacterium glaucum TaxID=187491 RepID=A0A1Q2HUC0_9CORY|nr:hypothetical protein [Corynebacterium glaucum]AQQ14433.1 hypothetical protein CGLAU_02240 [Corynebacterium glaucum]WJZ06955.1 hypothetical protein CGLAUT_02245 [Corynebacterium glaucum]